MKIKPIAFSFVVSLAISFIFLLITFWIFYKYSWSVEAAKEALSTTGSYFGAIATLGAACIAAYLFNDWRVVKQYEIILNFVMLIKTSVRDFQSHMSSVRSSYILDIYTLKKPTLSFTSYQEIMLSINDRERLITSLLFDISRDANELYYLKYKKPSDPTVEQLYIMIVKWQNLGISQENYFSVYENRLSDNTLQTYYDYLINDLMVFVYDKLFTKYLDELIL